MSAPEYQSTFSIALHHLSADAKTARADLPDVKLAGVPGPRLRALLDAMAGLAHSVAYPVAPELRISSPDGMFVVQVKAGQLHFVSWSSARPSSGEVTPAQIYASITGEENEEEAAPIRISGTTGQKAAPRSNKFKNMMTMVGLIAAIILVNSFTVWIVARPKKTMLPTYALMGPEPAERLLTSVAGSYEMGGPTGGRRLKIEKAGKVEWIKFGAEYKPIETKLFTVKAAEVSSKPALITSRKSMIEIKDSISVVLYGDTYKRVIRQSGAD